MDAHADRTYADLARRAISDYLERSTRFTPEDLEFRQAQSLNVLFRVDVNHQLSFRLNESTSPGGCRPSPEDVVAGSRREFKALANALCDEASEKVEIVRRLAETISVGRYGQFVGETILGAHSRRAYFTHLCLACSGTGSVTCDLCHGRGHRTCVHCGGMGSTTETHWETDHRGESTSTTRSETCTWCMGSGHDTCSECGGSGEVTCGACSGHGDMTDSAVPIYVAKSGYGIAELSTDDRDVGYALHKRTPLPRVGEGLARMDRRDVHAHESIRQVIEQVLFYCPFFKATLSVSGKSGKIVVFGERCLMSDAGYLIERLVGQDLIALQDALSRVRWFDVPAVLQAQEAGRLFMESEVHQMAIDCVPAIGNDNNYEAISDKLARAVSPAYLREVVGTLEHLTSTIKSETQRIVWLIAAPIVVVTTAYVATPGSYFMALSAAIGMGLLTSAVSQSLIQLQLRRTGSQRLEQFSARRKTHHPGLLTLPW